MQFLFNFFFCSLTKTMLIMYDTVTVKKAKEPITQPIAVPKSSWEMHQVKETAMVSYLLFGCARWQEFLIQNWCQTRFFSVNLSLLRIQSTLS